MSQGTTGKKSGLFKAKSTKKTETKNKKKKELVGVTKSGYYGSVITAQTRRTFERLQAEAYKDQYLRTTKEEDRVSEDKLDAMSKDYARFQTNKENKHYRAYLRGEDFYVYKRQRYPVLNEQFIRTTRDVKEIIKSKQSEENTKQT